MSAVLSKTEHEIIIIIIYLYSTYKSPHSHCMFAALLGKDGSMAQHIIISIQTYTQNDEPVRLCILWNVWDLRKWLEKERERKAHSAVEVFGRNSGLF